MGNRGRQSVFLLRTLSNGEYGFPVLQKRCVTGQKQHSFAKGLGKEKAVKGIFVKGRQGWNPQGMLSGYGKLGISVHKKHIPQSIGINFEIVAAESQFNDNFPDTGCAEK